ncbi:MAG: hypothetical protein QFE16_06395 [Pseudomonadota bacterium]|nr:hypothetical protein [Pseudomonadota bacterium]
MTSHINPSAHRARGSKAPRRTLALGASLALAMAGCGGSMDPNESPGSGLGVPTATQIADAQAALDGTVATDDSIAAKQLALDADADKAPD